MTVSVKYVSLVQEFNLVWVQAESAYSRAKKSSPDHGPLKLCLRGAEIGPKALLFFFWTIGLGDSMQPTCPALILGHLCEAKVPMPLIISLCTGPIMSPAIFQWKCCIRPATHWGVCAHFYAMWMAMETAQRTPQQWFCFSLVKVPQQWCGYPCEPNHSPLLEMMKNSFSPNLGLNMGRAWPKSNSTMTKFSRYSAANPFCRLTVRPNHNVWKISSC